MPTVNELDIETQTPETIQKTDRKLTSFFRDASERFQLKKKSFDRQYAHIYSKRLEKLRTYVSQEAKIKFHGLNSRISPYFVEAVFCDKISKAEDGVMSVITGTVIKEMPLITRVLDEFAKDVFSFL